MATSTRLPTRRQVYRAALILAFVLGMGAGLLMLGTPTATGATADLTLDTLNVTGVNETLQGNLTDVTLTVDLDYQFDVQDATQRVVKIRAGPNTSALSTVDYQVDMSPGGTGSGSIALSGSLITETDLTLSDVSPDYATTNSTEIVVQAVIEVTRDNGDVVTHTVTDTVAITLTDDAELTATVGGTGNVTVQTDA